uniref:Man1/Src1 C-terminal domain-containing protein n=1 Tax=Oryza barthii TaxID=65489 RepID=A0A0D3FCK0_9ORYZ
MPMPSRARRRSKSRWPLGEPPPGLFPARDDLLRLLAVVSIAAAAAAACSLLNRRPKPLCDSGGAAYTHHDSCQPCPPHGRCVDGNLECVQGFNKYGNLCIEDGLVSQTATKILLERRICDPYARALCGQPAKILFQELDILNMADELLSKGFVGLSQDGAKVAKIKVLDSARAFFEKTFSSDGVEEFKCPDLVAELYRPLTCQIRQWISRNIMSVTAFGVLHCSGFFGVFTRDKHCQRGPNKYMLSTSIHFSGAIHLYVSSSTISFTFSKHEGGGGCGERWILSFVQKKVVCEVLEDNAIDAKIGNSECEPWVVTSWLRDHLLVPQERRNAFLWKKVEELILEDSRIDQYPKVVKGESKVVYEWQASGSLSGKKKVKKMQGVAAGKSRADGAAGGAIKLAEELDAG